MIPFLTILSLLCGNLVFSGSIFRHNNFFFLQMLEHLNISWNEEGFYALMLPTKRKVASGLSWLFIIIFSFVLLTSAPTGWSPFPCWIHSMSIIKCLLPFATNLTLLLCFWYVARLFWILPSFPLAGFDFCHQTLGKMSNWSGKRWKHLFHSFMRPEICARAKSIHKKQINSPVEVNKDSTIPSFFLFFSLRARIQLSCLWVKR